VLTVRVTISSITYHKMHDGRVSGRVVTVVVELPPEKTLYVEVDEWFSSHT